MTEDVFDEIDALDPRKKAVGYPPIPDESLTPHKVVVFVLIQQYLKAKQAAAEIGIIFPPQPRRRFCMLLLKLIQYPDMTYKDLHNTLTSKKYKIDHGHMEGFEKCMTDLFAIGLENLFDIFDKTANEKLLAESGVSQIGIVGLYIRRVMIILERMSFPGKMALYKNISLYYEKGVRHLALAPRKGLLSRDEESTATTTANETEDDDDFVSILDTQTIHKERNAHSKWSVKQADLFITQQCNLLESNELRALPPIELQNKLYEILQDNPLMSQVHFLTYMNNLRLRDYFGSLDALHRSFDRSPMQNIHTCNETKAFQFYSINLAVMHANFGHREEALASLKESIMLAQEVGDKRCLDLANSWYCILNSNKINPFERCLPDFQDLNMVQALSLSIQFVVKIGAQCGYLPLDLFDLMQRSDELNSRNSLLEYFSDSLALRTALWTMYGKNELASVYSQMLLKLNKSWLIGDVGNSESVCMVLCNLALWLNIQGEYALCNVVLHHVKQRFIRNPLSNNWMICECYMIIQQSTYRCKWQEALRACDQLYVLDETASILQRASVYIARRYLTKARVMLDNLLSNNELDNLTRVRANILLAYSMFNHESMSAEIIDILNRTSTMACESYLDQELAAIDMLYSLVLLEMGLPQRSLEPIRHSMEAIFANGGLYDRSKANFIFVKCLVTSALTKDIKLKWLEQSLPMLEEAVEGFKKLEAHAKVLDVYSYLSVVYNDLGKSDERNKYAFKFRQYHNAYNVPTEYLNVHF